MFFVQGHIDSTVDRGYLFVSSYSMKYESIDTHKEKCLHDDFIT